MYLCLYEDDHATAFAPLTHTRAVYDLRLGIRTVRERTQAAFGHPSTLLHTRAHLAAVVAQENDLLVNRIPAGLDVLFVNGRAVFNAENAAPLLAATHGAEGRVFMQGDDVIAAWVPAATSARVASDALSAETFADLPTTAIDGIPMLQGLSDLIADIGAHITADFADIAHGYNFYEWPGATVHEGAVLVGGEPIYLGKGATIHPGAILNATDGPIYIGLGATVMETAVLRGPVAIGAKTTVKVAANLTNCAIGPVCKIGGEVHTSILHGYANKGHAGFLGHAYLGAWCNLGAATNNSNLRNDYGPVPLYNAQTGRFEKTDQTFLGLFMGDHSKSSINTMFNTGTIVGVGCNLFGAGFHPRFIPSFTWGSPQARYTTYRLQKAVAVAEVVYQRRKRTLSAADRELLAHIYKATETARAKGPVK